MLEISVRGKWTTVPSFVFGDKTIFIWGRWAKTARIHDEAWLDSELTSPEDCLQQLRSQRPKADLFSFAHMPPKRQAEFHYHSEPDSIAAIPLNDYKQWWESLPQETRKNVRRAERRGVRVETRAFSDELVAALVQLNNSSSVRQGRRYTHFGKSFEEVKKDHASFLDRSTFFCAHFEGQLIGFIKLVRRGHIASILNILTDEKHSDKRPANALMAAVVQHCFQEGLTCLTYGYFHYGNKRDTSITEFKVRHGFVEVLVPRYFIPLTLIGKAYIALGLHRGLIGLLPGELLKFGVALRAKWYDVRNTTLAGVAQR
ncbi:MAG TPA: GNAT family N-acetyltransferase [Bryobacteraceae bacterium]|nr:GNAT family N-acetyltransferase [Bryobacteraceae bacterium]